MSRVVLKHVRVIMRFHLNYLVVNLSFEFLRYRQRAAFIARARLLWALGVASKVPFLANNDARLHFLIRFVVLSLLVIWNSRFLLMYSFLGVVDFFIFFLILRHPGLYLFFEQLKLLFQPQREAICVFLLLALLGAISGDWFTVECLILFVVEGSSLSLVVIRLARQFFISVNFWIFQSWHLGVGREFRFKSFYFVSEMDDFKLHLWEGLFLHLEELMVVLWGFKGTRNHLCMLVHYSWYNA